MTNEMLRLDNQLCFPLYAASRKIVRMYRPLLEPLGLTYTQYITMMALWERDGVTVGELGLRLYLDSGTLTPLLKKMEAAGLVERLRGTEDERQVVITLTEDGRALEGPAGQVPLQMASCLQISREDAMDLHRLLYAVLGARDTRGEPGY